MSHYKLIVKAANYGQAVHHVCSRVVPHQEEDDVHIATSELTSGDQFLVEFNTDRRDVVRRLNDWFTEDDSAAPPYPHGSLLWWTSDDPKVINPYNHDPDVELDEPDDEPWGSDPTYATDAGERDALEHSTDPRV